MTKLRFSALFAVAAAAVFCGCQVRTPEREQPAAGAPGPVSPETVAAPFDLAPYAGKVVVLDFWATWSEPSCAQVPALNKVREDFADRGVEVVGLALDKGDAAAVAGKAQALGVGYPVQLADDAIKARYGVRVIPTTVLVDRKGEVRKTYAGPVAPEELRAQLIALMAEPPPTSP